LTKLTLSTYPDEYSRLSALKAGEVDALAELGAVLPAVLPAVPPAQAGEIRDDPDSVVQHVTTTCTTYLVFNGTKAPFDDVDVDVRIRQALQRNSQGMLVRRGAAALRSGPPCQQLHRTLHLRTMDQPCGLIPGRHIV